MSVLFELFHAVEVKTYGRNYIYWGFLPNYLAALLLSYWFTGRTLGSYWSIVLGPKFFVKIAARLFKGCREIVKFVRGL
jgi:hypothetical protein